MVLSGHSQVNEFIKLMQIAPETRCTNGYSSGHAE